VAKESFTARLNGPKRRNSSIRKSNVFLLSLLDDKPVWHVNSHMTLHQMSLDRSCQVGGV